MAFSTSLVLPLGGGGQAYVLPMPNLPTAGTWVTVASVDVPAGQWLVAANVTMRNGFTSAQVNVNGNLILGNSSGDSQMSTATTVTGPVKITVQVCYVKAGITYIVKLP